jgi:hypothetical protein
MKRMGNLLCFLNGLHVVASFFTINKKLLCSSALGFAPAGF